MNLKKSLTENLGVKLVALVVALFIWFNASGQKEVVWVKAIPVALENVPESLVVTGNVPDEVEVSITGTKRQLMLMSFKRMRLRVDLAEHEQGRQRVSLTPRQIDLPSGIDRRNVRIVEPTTLNLRLDRLVTRRTPVSLTTDGVIPDNLVLLSGSPSITPSWVSVDGPASVVERLRAVPTRPFDLSKVRESGERELELDFDRETMSCEPERVTVKLHVSPKGERVLANVPPTVLLDSDDFQAKVAPQTISLTLGGPQEVLDTLSSGDVSVLLNLGGLAEARYRIAPEVILPPAVELMSMSVDTLTVDIVKKARRGSR